MQDRSEEFASDYEDLTLSSIVKACDCDVSANQHNYTYVSVVQSELLDCVQEHLVICVGGIMFDLVSVNYHAL